jgi:hypothetical protein
MRGITPVPFTHEANNRGGGKTVQGFFKYLAKSLL